MFVQLAGIMREQTGWYFFIMLIIPQSVLCVVRVMQWEALHVSTVSRSNVSLAFIVMITKPLLGFSQVNYNIAIDKAPECIVWLRCRRTVDSLYSITIANCFHSCLCLSLCVFAHTLMAELYWQYSNQCRGSADTYSAILLLSFCLSCVCPVCDRSLDVCLYAQGHIGQALRDG